MGGIQWRFLASCANTDYSSLHLRTTMASLSPSVGCSHLSAHTHMNPIRPSTRCQPQVVALGAWVFTALLGMQMALHRYGDESGYLSGGEGLGFHASEPVDGAAQQASAEAGSVEDGLGGGSEGGGGGGVLVAEGGGGSVLVALKSAHALARGTGLATTACGAAGAAAQLLVLATADIAHGGFGGSVAGAGGAGGSAGGGAGGGGIWEVVGWGFLAEIAYLYGRYVVLPPLRLFLNGPMVWYGVVFNYLTSSIAQDGRQILEEVHGE